MRTNEPAKPKTSGRLSKFLNQPLTRKQFLIRGGAAGLSLMGATAALKAMGGGSFFAKAEAAGLDPYYDVTASPYSADSSGATDATAAINQAIADAVAAGGGVVFLPPGTYLVSGNGTSSNGALHVNGSNVVLQGSGMGVTTILAAANATSDVTGVIRCPAGNATLPYGTVAIRDLSVNGNCGINSLSGGNSNSVNIYGFYCGSTPYSGSTPGAITNIRLENVEVYNCSSYGFDPHERTQGLMLRGCVAHDNGINGTSYKDGFDLDAQYDFTVENCLSYSNGRHGFNLTTGSQNGTLVNCRAYNNGAGSTTTSGAGVSIQTGSKFITITGGQFYLNKFEGIVMNGVAQNGQADTVYGQGNTVIGTKVWANGTHGIHLTAAVYNTISGCHIFGNSQTTNHSSNGIYLDESSVTPSTTTGSSGSNTVTVNSATNIGVGMSVTGTGIGASATVTAISGTTITLSVNNSGTVSNGVTFAGYSNHNVVVGNYVLGAVPSGYTTAGPAGGVNTNQQKYGILEKTSNEDYNSVRENRVAGNFTADINMLGTNSSTASANNLTGV